MAGAPDFTTNVYVDIDAADLEEAGWVYVGASTVTPATALQAIADHHADHHEGAQRFCPHPLCQAVATG